MKKLFVCIFFIVIGHKTFFAAEQSQNINNALGVAEQNNNEEKFNINLAYNGRIITCMVPGQNNVRDGKTFFYHEKDGSWQETPPLEDNSLGIGHLIFFGGLLGLYFVGMSR